MPRGARRLPEACVARLRSADLILHAGDFITVAVLEEIEAIGPPVAGVHGNVDEPEMVVRLPAARMVEAEGARIAIVHDAGAPPGASSACASASGTRTRSSSATPTSRCTSRTSTAAFRSSTPAARPSGAARRVTRWASAAPRAAACASTWSISAHSRAGTAPLRRGLALDLEELPGPAA